MSNQSQNTPLDHQPDMTPRKKVGGARAGSGRKVGTGKFQEPTVVMRVPTSQKPVISDFLAAYARKQQDSTFKLDIDAIAGFEFPNLQPNPIKIALFNSKVPAGFPSPADDHIEKRLDPSEFLIDRVESTFFVTIQGYSMIDEGLLPGDRAVVDRSKLVETGDIVLAIVDGEFTIKKLAKTKEGRPILMPANSSGEYKPIEVTQHMQVEIWGVVTGSFRRFKK